MIRKNLINNIDNFLGKLIFKSFNSFRYCIFDSIIYHKNLKKNLRNNGVITNFNNRGFCKIKSIDNNDITELKKIFLDDNNASDKENSYTFKPSLNSEKGKNLIKNIIRKNLSETLRNLNSYYNKNIYLTNVELKKTFHINKEHEENEYFNNFFHIDSYLRTHFKIFINVSDIEEKNGPTEVFDLLKTKKIRQFNSFENKRGNLKIPSDIRSYLNTGKAGEVLLCNTSLCLHRATNPEKGNTRENLILTFVSYPSPSDDLFHYEKIDPDSIWTNKNSITKTLAKPRRYSEVISLLKKFV